RRSTVPRDGQARALPENSARQIRSCLIPVSVEHDERDALLCPQTSLISTAQRKKPLRGGAQPGGIESRNEKQTNQRVFGSELVANTYHVNHGVDADVGFDLAATGIREGCCGVDINLAHSR